MEVSVAKTPEDRLDETEARLIKLETLVKVAGAVAIVLGLGGGWLGSRLASALADTKQLRSEVDQVKGQVPTLLDESISAAKSQLSTFAESERRRIASEAVGVSYTIATGQPLTSGQVTRIDFDRQLADTNEHVKTGKEWRFHAPAPGHYIIDIDLQTNRSADLALTIRSRKVGPVFQTSGLEVSSLSLPLILQLDADDDIWVELAHSMHPTTVIRGYFRASLLRKHQNASS